MNQQEYIVVSVYYKHGEYSVDRYETQEKLLNTIMRDISAYVTCQVSDQCTEIQCNCKLNKRALRVQEAIKSQNSLSSIISLWKDFGQKNIEKQRGRGCVSVSWGIPL